MKERREWERFHTAYPIEEAENTLSSILTMKDVSEEGVAFRASRSFEQDEKIDLRIFLKNKMFKVKAKIVHSLPSKDQLFNIGARFVNTKEEFRGMLLKELEDIKHFLKECNLHRSKKISFRKAAEKYLKDAFPPRSQ